MKTPPFTIKGTADYFGVSPDLVRSWIRDREIDAFDVSSKPGTGHAVWRISAEAIEAFIAKRRVGPPPAKTMIARRRRMTKPAKQYV